MKAIQFDLNPIFVVVFEKDCTQLCQTLSSFSLRRTCVHIRMKEESVEKPNFFIF